MSHLLVVILDDLERLPDLLKTWQEIGVPAGGLAFTWCQVPLVYHLDDSATATVSIHWDNGEHQTLPALALPAELAEHIFRRNGRIRQVDLVLTSELLYSS